MTRSSLRLWGVLIVASIGLAACSSSESSSSIRTRNSATVDACILVSPSTDTPEITARLANPSCGVAIVDMTAIPNPQYALRPTGSTTRPKSPQVEHLNPTLQQVTSTHSSGPYRFAYEARDADNNPIHYVEVINESETGEAASMLLKYAVPFEISQSESCIKPNVYPIASRPNFLISGDTTSCDNSRQLVINQGDRFVGVHPMAKPTPANVTSYMLVEHFSLTTIKNGFPDQRFTAIPLGGGQFEYRFYRFSPSVEVRPFQADPVADTSDAVVTPQTSTTEAVDTVPTDSSTTTSTTATVATTVAPGTTTTITSATTTTTTSTTTTSTTTTSTTTPAAIATDRTEADVCDNLEGVEVYPAFDTWTSSTRFELTISNDCMRYPPPAGGSRGIGHSMNAYNEETNERVYFNTTGDSISRVTFNGRLYPGDWTIEIEQNVNSSSPDSPDEPYVSIHTRTIPVTVTEDASAPWDLCDSGDVTWNGNEVSLDCDYSQAALVIPFDGEEDPSTWLGQRGTSTPVSLPNGWNIALMSYDVDGYNAYIPLIICSTGCEVFNNDLSATVELVDAAIIANVTSHECANEGSTTLYFFLRQANRNLLVFNTSLRNFGFDGQFDPRETFRMNPREGTDHVVMTEILDYQCAQEAGVDSYRYSIVPIPQSPITEQPVSTENEQPTPIRVANLEYSRSNTIGAPVIVAEAESSSVLISPIDVPSFATTPESGVTIIEVRASGETWRPLSTVAPTVVPIDQDSTAIEVKYTFSDGTEAVVTKPIVSSSDVVTTDDKSTSNILLFTVLILVSVTVSLGGYAVTRRRA